MKTPIGALVALVGVVFLNFVFARSVEAASSCCIYYFGQKGEACAVYDTLKKDLVNFGIDDSPIKAFACNLYNDKVEGCENGNVTIDNIGLCVDHGMTFFHTTLAGSKENDADVSKGASVCLGVEGYTVELVSEKDSLCAVGTAIANKPISNVSDFKNDYNKALQKQVLGFDPQAIKTIFDDQFGKKYCCVPKIPGQTQCRNPHLKNKYKEAISNYSSQPSSQQAQVPAELIDLKKNIDSGNYKDLVVCDDAMSDENFSLYNFPCEWNMPVVPPSDKYKNEDGSVPYGYISDYCGTYTYDVPKLESDPPNVFGIPEVKGLNKLGTTDVNVIIGRVIKTIMGIMGSIALAMFVYSGIMWMTAAGNSAKEDKSKMILVWSAFGVVAIFGSYALLNFVFEIVK